MLKVSNYSRYRGNLFVKNNLTQKPSKAIEPVKKIIQNSGYNMSLKQDYSKNVVEMNLLSSFLQDNGEYYILQSRKLPVVSAIKAYTKNAQGMIESQDEYFKLCNQRFSHPKPTIWERLKDYLKEMFEI